MERQLYRRRTCIGSFATAALMPLISSPATAPVASLWGSVVTRSGA